MTSLRSIALTTAACTAYASSTHIAQVDALKIMLKRWRLKTMVDCEAEAKTAPGRRRKIKSVVEEVKDPEPETETESPTHQDEVDAQQKIDTEKVVHTATDDVVVANHDESTIGQQEEIKIDPLITKMLYNWKKYLLANVNSFANAWVIAESKHQEFRMSDSKKPLTLGSPSDKVTQFLLDALDKQLLLDADQLLEEWIQQSNKSWKLRSSGVPQSIEFFHSLVQEIRVLYQNGWFEDTFSHKLTVEINKIRDKKNKIIEKNDEKEWAEWNKKSKKNNIKGLSLWESLFGPSGGPLAYRLVSKTPKHYDCSTRR